MYANLKVRYNYDATVDSRYNNVLTSQHDLLYILVYETKSLLPSFNSERTPGLLIL